MTCQGVTVPARHLQDPGCPEHGGPDRPVPLQADNVRPYIPIAGSDIIMYYYNVDGAALVSLTPLEGLGPEAEPSTSWRLFAAGRLPPALS